VIDGICGRPKDWTEGGENIKPVIDAYSIFFIKSIGLELKEKEIEYQLQSLDVKPDDRKIILECVEVRAKDVRESLTHNASTLAKSYLKDFDWKLQIVLSDDKIAQSRTPLLRLSLILVGEDGKKRDLVLELPKEDLDKFINTLTDVNKSLQKLRS